MEEVVCPKCETQNTADSRFCKSCATPLPEAGEILFTKTIETPADRLTPGTVFAKRYLIIEELGRGGMGRVYKAQDTQIKETVAVKLIRSEIAEDEKVLERFANELKLARKIAHKNVCRMYHLEKEGETTFISMEYLEGEDLKGLIRKKGSLPETEATGIAAQICEGLAEAHRQGIVHRDLKPSNIMVDTSGLIKIMDFGIARSTEAPGVTKTGAIVGTPDYMSPEQADGLAADQRSDVYSLGIILYEMVTGELPFRGETALSVAMKHKSQLPSDPGKLNPALSVDLRRLILVCLEKDPKRRYQTAAALLSDLGNINEGLPLGTKIQPRRATALSRLVRRRWFVPTTAVLGAAVLGLILWRVLPSRSPIADLSGKPSLAVLHFQNMTGDEGLDRTIASLPYLLTTDLEQSKYLTVVPDTTINGILQELNLDDIERLTTENLNKIAERTGASFILRGIVTKPSSSLRMKASIHEMPGMNISGNFDVQGNEEGNFFHMVDELTLQVKSNFLSESQIKEDIDLEIEKVTTSSPEALALYVEARKYFNSDPVKSVELHKKAIEIDPEFAMAYRSLSLCYGQELNDRKQGDVYWKKMLEKIDGLPTRERLLILAQNTPIWEKRLSLLEELLWYYPDHSLGRGTLGTGYLSREHFDKAVEQFEIAIKNKNAENIGYLYSQLAWTYVALGEYDKIENLIDIREKEGRKEDALALPLAFAYVAQGKKALAYSELAKIKEFPNDYKMLRWIGWLYVALGDEAEAERVYRRFFELESKFTHPEGWLRLGDLSCLQGKFKKAEEQYREGLKLAEEIKGSRSSLTHALLTLALIRGDVKWALEQVEKYEGTERSDVYIAAGKFDKAQEIVEKIRKRHETSPFGLEKKQARWLAGYEGELALGKGDYAEAIAQFKKAQDSLAYPFPDNIEEYPLYFEPLARAYYRSGDLEKAQEEFEKISKMILGRVASLDIYAKSFYMLGKISEQRGWPGKAIDYYEQFLEVWKDADPDVPELIDAKKRLTELKG